MSKTAIFKKFLNKLVPHNPSLLESITKGFDILFENVIKEEYLKINNVEIKQVPYKRYNDTKVYTKTVRYANIVFTTPEYATNFINSIPEFKATMVNSIRSIEPEYEVMSEDEIIKMAFDYLTDLVIVIRIWFAEARRREEDEQLQIDDYITVEYYDDKYEMDISKSYLKDVLYSLLNESHEVENSR